MNLSKLRPFWLLYLIWQACWQQIVLRKLACVIYVAVRCLFGFGVARCGLAPGAALPAALV
jgi:hypothetical protein